MIITLAVQILVVDLPIAVTLLIFTIEHSSFGWALVAIREDEDAAEIIGVRTTAVKWIANALGAGIAGGFYAQRILYLEPSGTFAFDISLNVVLMAVIGGAGTWQGPLIGAPLVLLVADALRVTVTSEHCPPIIPGCISCVIAPKSPRNCGAAGLRMPSNVAVAAYDTDLELELDVKTLQRGGFDMTRVCVIGSDHGAAQHLVAFVHPGRRARFFGKHGLLWTTLSGILFGAALAFVPLTGPIVIVGPLAKSMVAGLEAPALRRGLGPLATALAGLGIPEEAALAYESAIRAQRILLIVRGDAHAIQRARQLLYQTRIDSFESA
jgi:hypothetical protein